MIPHRDGIVATTVAPVPQGLPQVQRAAFFPGTPNAELLDQAGKELRANTFRCATVLLSGEYQVLTVDAPNVPTDELKTAVRWRLKDLLDFPANEATIDVLSIPPDPNGAARQQAMFVIAARNNVIAPRQRMFAAARVGLSVIDIPEMAQRNISALLAPQGRGLAMLSFDEDGGLLTVTYAGELYLARRIEIPLAQLTEPDHERRLQGFDRITLELQRSLDNLERQFSFISVSKLLLGPSAIEGLDAYLSSNLYAPVESLDLASVFDLQHVPELADSAQQQRFFTALGAGLRSEGSAA